MSHLSVETLTYVKQSDKILYSLNEPAIESWVKKNNSNAESLAPFENKYALRLDAYRAITDYIVENVRKPQHVCVLFYGHPTVFAKSALDAAFKAQQEGFFTKILPGISAEACLFADLWIDPGSCGCQSYEATDFLIRRRPINSSSHLILWQVGMIGALGDIRQHNNQRSITVLLNYLTQCYDVNHEVTLYEAALYPHLEPRVEKFALKKLIDIELSSLSTLYIPPSHQLKVDLAVIDALGINPTHL